jgi:3-hexulose-6-phosphate synthase/6-phospho-3-hexuloisomerase
LDFTETARALRCAQEAIAGGIDWLEAGTPLIKSEGLDSVRALRKAFPKATIVADLKTMDAGRSEMEMAAKAGADIATVMAAASDATIEECIEAGRNYGIRVAVDLLNIAEPVERAKRVASLGPSHIGVHVPIDDQMRGKASFETLRRVAQAVDLPVAIAGGINSETCVDALDAGAQILILGGAVIKSQDAKAAVEEIRRAVQTHAKIETKLYKRVTEKDVRELLLRVSTANICDAHHRMPCLPNLGPISDGLKLVGPAVTVRTIPGDWAKPVEAIDLANPGDVIVIQTDGTEAVWGELATHSAKIKGVAGVVIDGGVRDVAEIRRMGLPVFARTIQPTAGDPKGFGEVNAPIRIGGIRICPGDWIVGDDDGVVAIPRLKAVEIANRAMDCLEKENRIRQEIEAGRSSLAKVTDLLRWEKQ